MSTLLKNLADRGITLEPKLTFKSATPVDAEALALLQHHKHELLQALVVAENIHIPCLPWQLQRLLRAASNDGFNIDLKDVPDAQRYTLAWGCAYLIGDHVSAVIHLQHVYNL